MVTITDAPRERHRVVLGRDDGLRAAQSSPYAAQVAADDAGKKAAEHGVRTLEVEVKGPGSGRGERAAGAPAVGFTITSIRDVTPIPHNGVRPSSAPPRLVEACGGNRFPPLFMAPAAVPDRGPAAVPARYNP